MTSSAIHDATHDDDLIPQPDWPAVRASDLVHAKETAMTTVDWTTLHAALAQPFPERELRYRAGATNRDKTQALALPYVDPRAYEDRLNELVPGHWHVAFEPWGESRIICQLTIHGVMRSSTGEAGDSPDGIAGTSAEAQSFKRACAKFGLGRYLYAVTPEWRAYDATTRSFPARSTGSKTSTIAAPSIGGTRAEHLRALLIERGIPEGSHGKLASDITGRRTATLAKLTNDAAQRLWHRISPPTRSQPRASQDRDAERSPLQR